jgi:hypothetical protein
LKFGNRDTQGRNPDRQGSSSYDLPRIRLSKEELEIQERANAEYDKRLKDLHDQTQANESKLVNRVYNSTKYNLGFTNKLDKELRSQHENEDFVRLKWLANISGYDDVITFLINNPIFTQNTFYTNTYGFYDKVTKALFLDKDQEETYQTYFFKIDDVINIHINFGKGKDDNHPSTSYILH